MRPRYLVPIASLLLGSACVPATPPLPIPVSEAVFVRVTYQTECSRGPRCTGAWPEELVITWPEEPIDGLVLWLDRDNLVVYSSWAAPHVTIPVAHITKLEVCRAQGETCAPIATTPRDVAPAIVFGVALGGAAYGVASSASWAVQPDFAEAAAEAAAAGVGISADADAATGDPLWEEVTVEQLFEELRLKRKLKEELAEPAEAVGSVPNPGRPPDAAPTGTF